MQSKWWKLATAEDKFLKQRSRIKWIKDGDKNTSFFHRVIQARKAKNHIPYLQNNGSRLDKKEEMSAHVIEYFSKVLASDDPHQRPELIEKIKDLTTFRCDQQMKDLLQAEVSDMEIKQEVFALPKQKCPGPDGYTAEFFTRSWQVIGEDVVSAVREFFTSGCLLKQLNATSIVLVPKSAGADTQSNFRPISLSNVLYKVISMILTRRLQSLLPAFISSNQTAFVKGRSLIENVILATELVKGFGTKSQTTRGALKVDLSKAFDTVRWDFIIHILQAAEFPPIYINWIWECISTASFSVSLNGEPCGFFKGKRGLRQGDPLSPSLFLIAMQVFGELLKSEFDKGNIVLHDLCREPLITHLAFADDIMVFFDGKPKSLMGIKEVLSIFQEMSGLTVNMAKTMVYLSGLSQSEESEASDLGFQIGTLPVRYLGLPLLTRRMQKADYSPLLDAISKRFTSWTIKPLSFAGRLLLISSVIYSVMNFWMGAFLLPKGCIREITRLCTRFLWSGDISKHGHAKVSWKLLCLPKREGGLGLRDLTTWNTTLQLKLVWSLFSKESLWVRWVKTHWLKHRNFWTAPTTSNISWVWRSILHLRLLAIKLISCKVGNGDHVSFWYDHWHTVGPLIQVAGEEGPLKLGIPRDATVSQAVRGNRWRSPVRIRSPSLAEIRNILHRSQLSLLTPRRDQFLWGGEHCKSTYFSAKKTWDLLRPKKEEQSWTRLIWSKSSSPKQSFLFWVITHNRLPLRSRLRSWGLDINDACLLCNSSHEERNHLFLNCDFVLQIWDWVAARLRSHGVPRSWDALLHWIISATSRKLRTLRIIASQAIAYEIWMERNTRLHMGTTNTVANSISKIDKTVRALLLAVRSRKHHSQLLSMWFTR